MTLLGNIAYWLTHEYVLLFFFAFIIYIWIQILFFPPQKNFLSNRNPAVYRILLFITFFMQFPLLFGMYWGLGMKYAEVKSPILNFFTDPFSGFLIMIGFYVIIFFISTFLQMQRSREQDWSFIISALTTLGLSPLLYFTLIQVLGNWLRS